MSWSALGRGQADRAILLDRAPEDIVGGNRPRLAEGDRMMCLTVHPAIVGQAQRARYFDEIMRYITSFPDVWFATGAEIAEHYMANCYDRVIEKLTEWQHSPG